METVIPIVDGDCRLLEQFLTQGEANRLLDELLENAAWQQPEITLYGRKVKSPRLAAWYGDPQAVYRYSGLVNRPSPWLSSLLELRYRLEAFIGCRFNSVLMNQYRDGADSMGWHADDEPELGPDPVIASVSLGSSRHFLMKHRKHRAEPSVKLSLHHGSLLIMGGTTQQHWKHSISKTKSAVGKRINLTYRLIRGDELGAK
ncbi:MAG: alpha-ketoglutarate-dependent dioxygenase AlkB [Arenicellales bacterium]